MELFPYQVEGAKFLASVKRGLLADEMGLGKSAQAIAACDAVKAKSVTIVCPASLVTNWSREVERFRTTEWDICIFSYNKALEYMQAMWKHGREPAACDVLILDEAHYLKNHKAKRTQAIFGPKCDGDGGLVSRAAHVFCLTGTPTPNNPSELWPMLRAVMPASIVRPMKNANINKPMSYWPFVEKFCVTRDTGFGIQIVKGKNLPELKERIAPYILRRKKDDVLKDLPPIRFDTLALEGKWPKEANEESWVVAKALDEHGIDGLKALGPHVAQLRRLTGLAKVPAAIDWITDYFEADGKKLVVFAHHKDVLQALLDEFGGMSAVVRGDTLNRDEAVQRFQNEVPCRLFLGQIQAAGVGLTLTAASDVLFVESSWVPAENEQAAMRVHRIGQRNACLVRFAMLAGSIDEQIQRAVVRKAADISKLFS